MGPSRLSTRLITCGIWILTAMLVACSTPSGTRVGPAPRPRQAETTRSDAPIRARLDAVRQLAAQGREDEFARALGKLAEDSRLSELDEESRHWVLSWAGRFAIRDKQWTKSYELLSRASASPSATSEDWEFRGLAAAVTGHDEDAVSSIATQLRRWPATAGDLDEQLVRHLLRKTWEMPQDSKLALDFLNSLFDARWKVDHAIEPSEVWEDLILRLLQSGQTSRAVEVAARVDDPYDLLDMVVDRRYSSILAARGGAIDVDASMVRYSAMLEDASRLQPLNLSLRRSVAEALRKQGRYSAALAVLDSALADVAQAAEPARTFANFEEEYLWILNDRAVDLWRLGRWEEAIAQLRTAAERSEGSEGTPNVSQRINLAAALADLGRSREALQEIDRLRDVPMSPYGYMQAYGVRYQAEVALHEDPQASAALKFLRAHRLDAPYAFQTALIEANRPDEAAAAIIEQLDDLKSRRTTLRGLQHYLDDPAPPHVVEMRRRWQAVGDRPDVQAALARVGTRISVRLEREQH